MDGSILRCANRIKNICLTLKALPSDSAFSDYRRRLFAELQRLALTIGLEEREDDFDESKVKRDKNGQFAAKGGGAAAPESARKGKMKPETPASFKNPTEIGKDGAGRPITHFNHDADTMHVAKQINVFDECMDKYEIQVGDIEHLTAYAGKGTDVELGVAKSVARQYGGKPEDWKHVKGIGKVKGRDGKIEEADLHWFENPEVGQAGWKIKQFRGEMGEGQIYWESK